MTFSLFYLVSFDFAPTSVLLFLNLLIILHLDLLLSTSFRFMKILPVILLSQRIKSSQSEDFTFSTCSVSLPFTCVRFTFICLLYLCMKIPSSNSFSFIFYLYLLIEIFGLYQKGVIVECTGKT